MDSRNGILSRSMRNRFVEIFVGNGKFWDYSIESLFKNTKISEEKIEKNLLSWIISTSISESIKQKALNFSINSLKNISMYELVEKY